MNIKIIHFFAFKHVEYDVKFIDKFKIQNRTRGIVLKQQSVKIEISSAIINYTCFLIFSFQIFSMRK